MLLRFNMIDRHIYRKWTMEGKSTIMKAKELTEKYGNSFKMGKCTER